MRNCSQCVHQRSPLPKNFQSLLNIVCGNCLQKECPFANHCWVIIPLNDPRCWLRIVCESCGENKQTKQKRELERRSKQLLLLFLYFLLFLSIFQPLLSFLHFYAIFLPTSIEFPTKLYLEKTEALFISNALFFSAKSFWRLKIFSWFSIVLWKLDWICWSSVSSCRRRLLTSSEMRKSEAKRSIKSSVGFLGLLLLAGSNFGLHNQMQIPLSHDPLYIKKVFWMSKLSFVDWLRFFPKMREKKNKKIQKKSRRNLNLTSTIAKNKFFGSKLEWVRALNHHGNDPIYRLQCFAVINWLIDFFFSQD